MDRLYAALPDAVAVVDVDAGEAVVRRRSPMPERSLRCVAASPTDPDVVCCGTADDGLLRSTDAGERWDRAAGIEHDRVTSVTCAVTADGDEGWVEGDAGAAERDVTWWAGTEPSRVYASSDGATWHERDGLTGLPSSSSWAFPPRPATHHVRWIEVDPHDPRHLYVAVEAGALVGTHDAGETWTDRVPGSRIDTHSMATHADAPGRAYCAAGDGYAETDDGGKTWTPVQQGLAHHYCWSVVVDPADPDHRLVSAARGATTAHRAGSADSYVYRKRGETAWERVTGLPTGAGVTRYVLGAGTEGLYALSNRGLFRSAGGETWTRLPLSVPTDAVAAGLAVVGR
jgi:photosystem II stability/assembly factor-like uncharacterized protein